MKIMMIMNITIMTINTMLRMMKIIKNWSRFSYINSDPWDWYSLDERYLELEKKENEKKNIKNVQL